MPGYIDSFPVPLHLSLILPSTKSSVKGKGKETSTNSNPTNMKSYDIVANWTKEEKDDVERKVNMAIKLGYSTIVLTISIYPTTNPSTLIYPTPLFPLLDPRTAKSSGSSNSLILQLWKLEVKDYTEESVKNAGAKGIYGFANSTAALYPPSLSLLSVVPTCLPSFSHVALSISSPSAFCPTLITIDPSLSTRLPFPLKRGMVSSLIRSGMMIELIYRGIVRQDLPEDGTAGGSSGIRRKNWIGGAREIVRAMGGSGIVLSSGAVKAGEMRGTEDLINLCSLIGLTTAQAKDTLTINPQRAISRGLALRQSYRGVLSNPTLIETTSSSDLSTNSSGAKRPAELMESSRSNLEQSVVDPSPGKKRKGEQ